MAFHVGVTDAVPESVTYRLLLPATRMPTSVRIVKRNGALAALLSELAVQAAGSRDRRCAGVALRRRARA